VDTEEIPLPPHYPPKEKKSDVSKPAADIER